MQRDVVQQGRAGHWGLQGMAERAHKLQAVFVVESTPEHGTTIRLTVPASMAYRQGSSTVRGAIQSWVERKRSQLFAKDLY